MSGQPGARLLELVATMDRLRSPGGCPWDAEQTHASLAPYLLEETYEALEAIETGDRGALREELGDVLLQVVFHARLAQEEPGGWDIDDVAGGIVDKLVRRHPHVFGDTTVDGAAHVAANWEVLKRAEKQRTSLTDGVPLGQPALALTAALRRRAARAGLPAAAAADPAAAVSALAGRLDAATVGEALFAVATLAATAGVDPEAALRERARRYRDELRAAEQVPPPPG